MKANFWRPVEAACADRPSVRAVSAREVGALEFLKIVGICALALTAMALAVLGLAVRHSGDRPAIAEVPVHAALHPTSGNPASREAASGACEPPDGAALDLALPRAIEVERAEPLEVPPVVVSCEASKP